MKDGDKVLRISGDYFNCKHGEIYIVNKVLGGDIYLLDRYGEELHGCYMLEGFKVVEDYKERSTTPNYAAAFNAWQDDFINNPQAYEDSQTVAIRHLTEKLNGEEPSYGQVAAQMLIEYLNKLESK